MEWLSYGAWALIPIVGTIAWGAIGVTRAMRGGTGKAELDGVAKRLDAIDARLAAVEKTLNDIP